MTFTPIGRLNYLACKKAGISVISGLIADYVFQLEDTENDRWCAVNNHEASELLNISLRSVSKILSDLIGENLLETNGFNNQNRLLRTTDFYIEIFSPQSATQNLPSDLKEDVSATQNLPSDLKEDISATQNLPSDLKEDVSATQNLPSDLKEDVSATQNLPSDLKEDISATQNLPSDLKEDVSATQNLPSDLKEDVSATQNLPSDLKEDVSATQNLPSDLKEDVSATQNLPSDLKEDVSATQNLPSDLKEDVSATQNLPSEQKNQENFANSSSSILVLDSYTNKILKEEEKNKILSEKNKKNSAEKKSPAGKYPEGFFSKCRTRYEVWREVNGWQPEYFTAKELGNLRNLINALAHSIREIDSEGTPSPTNYDEVYIAFDSFFGNMPNRIMQQPISLSMLYSRYNEIMGEQHLTGKLYSPEIEAVIASFRTENKSLHQDYIATDAERKAVIELQKLLTASAKSKNPTTNPSTEQLQKWSTNLFAKINNLEWWGSKVGSIASIVKNYNNIAKAIQEANNPTITKSGKTEKEPAFYRTVSGWKNPAAALFEK